jgi:hypothetical protein
VCRASSLIATISASTGDERMGVTAFYEGQQFLYELVKSLAK